MKQVWIPRTGEPHVLEVRERPDPEPGVGEVRVKVEAAGVNFADLMTRIGVYPDAPPLPAVVGYEVAGEIDAVGAGVDGSWVGMPVVAATRFGGYSSHVVVDKAQAVARPEGLDAITAAAIPVTGLTAWMMLEQLARVREGDRVLVHSAGGGVGLMALDLIRRRGGIAIGTASKKKHEFLLERGYERLVDYTTEDYERALQGTRIDIILDPIGGESWAKGLRLLGSGGKLVCFGFSAAAKGKRKNLVDYVTSAAKIPWLKFNPITLLNENKAIMGVNMGRMWSESERLAGWLEQLLAMWTKGELRPRVHASVPFSNASEAHRILHDRENLGKVVLLPD